MSSRFDICLLLYVIRLAGWLKHCNLSLSESTIAPVTEATKFAVQMLTANHKW